MNTDSAIKIKKEHDKKDFIREVAIYLAKEEATPTDILERSFSNVKEEQNEYLLITADTQVDYSCSIGYDRKEQYTTTERKYLSAGDWYVCDGVKKRAPNSGSYQVDCTKERTVTDWQSFSGSNSTEETTVVANYSNQEKYSNGDSVVSCYQTSKEESREELTEMLNINADALETAKDDCIRSCFYSVKLPGDKQKDKNYSGTCDVSQVLGVICPEYEVDYDYQGIKYKAKGFAAGDIQVRADYPNISTDVSKEAKNSVKHFKFLAIISLIVGVILNLFMNSIGMWCLAGYAAAITFLVLYIKIGNAKMKSIYAIRQEEKKKDLVAFLQKNGLKPLTAQEISEFSK